MLLADELLKGGDEKGAEAIYKKLLQAGNHRGPAAQKLAKLSMKRGDYGEAGRLYRESARLLRESAR